MIDTLPSGNIRARYTGPDGRRHPAPSTFRTKGAARTWLAQRQAEIAAGTWQPPEVVEEQRRQAEREAARKAVTLGDYAATWVAERTNSRGEPLRDRTRVEYERLLRAPRTRDAEDEGGPLAPLLDHLIGDITPEQVRTWRTKQLKRGTKTQTARAYDLLKSILKTAHEDGLIPENPCRVKGGSATSTGKPVVPPTDKELDTIIARIDPRYRAITVLAGLGGLRWGEASELRARDITVEKSDDGEVTAVRVRVERQVIYTPETGRQPGDVKAAASERTITLFGEDARIVAEQVKNKIGDALLTTNAAGDGWLPQTSFFRHWNKARIAAGRPDLPFHGLRHYAGTRYAQAGATTAETMARLGHSSTKAAMRYQHAGTRDDELAMRMARTVS